MHFHIHRTGGMPLFRQASEKRQKLKTRVRKIDPLRSLTAHSQADPSMQVENRKMIYAPNPCGSFIYDPFSDRLSEIRVQNTEAIREADRTEMERRSPSRKKRRMSFPAPIFTLRQLSEGEKLLRSAAFNSAQSTDPPPRRPARPSPAQRGRRGCARRRRCTSRACTW